MQIRAGAFLYYYQPFFQPRDMTLRSSFDLYAFFLTLDKDSEWGGAHAEWRARDRKLRGYYPSATWFQEVYAYGRLGQTQLKIGKVYRQIGLPSDGSFYGSIAFFDGLTLDPDYGVSLETTSALNDKLTLTRHIQYFLHSDHINGSLGPFDRVTGPLDQQFIPVDDPPVIGPPAARDVEGEQNAQERNTWASRLALEKRAGRFFVRPGVSIGSGHIERQGDGNNVTTWGVELTISQGANFTGSRIYGHLLARNGRSARDYPLVGGAANAVYWEAGIAKVGNLGALRYNVNGVTYKRTGVREIMHQPGVSLALGARAALIVEYVVWLRSDTGVRRTMDRSLSTVLKAAF
jgi:hypothetical protein